MIRITQVFECTHESPARAVEIKTQGHSVALEERVCYCLGRATAMKNKVTWSDPDAGRPH